MYDIKNLNEFDIKGEICRKWSDSDIYLCKKGKEDHVYINKALAIDIETTSTIYEGNKIAFPWCFQVGYDNTAYITRHYQEFFKWFIQFNKCLEYSNIHIHCLIHNLPYEFMFFKDFINFKNVFATAPNKPLVCEYGNIRFLDSCRISGYSLESLSKNYTETKKVKDIDYIKYRVPETQITPQELRYCADDVKILNEYWYTDEIQRYINKSKYTNIPLTNTAKVRRYTKSKNKGGTRYKEFLQYIYPDTDTWDMLDKAFIGGVVKSNPYYTAIELNDVKQVDLTSSYPASMFKSNHFPMDKFIDCDLKSLNDININDYCYLIEVELTDIESINPMRILSLSKLYDLVNYSGDNGRLIKADSCKVTLTDLDFLYLFKFYKFDYKILKSKYTKARYLPRFIINALVDLYQLKNELKEELKEDPHNQDLNIKYLNSKGMLNSLYGMMVTKEQPFNFKYVNGMWLVESNDKWHVYDSNSFLAYQWGVWVTALSRASLYAGILECENDIVYSDTDSCKFINEDHLSSFDELNTKNDMLVKQACEHFGVDYSIMEGIGRWDREDDINIFKTMGSKRYYTYSFNKKSGHMEEHVTISGIKDSRFIEYATEIYPDEQLPALKFFDNNASIPKERTGKNTAHYNLLDSTIQYEYEYEGVHHSIPVRSNIYMEQAPWSMTLSDTYEELITRILMKKGMILNDGL